jgi:hypothetical protein
MNADKFTLNVAPLKIEVDPNWTFLEINTHDWKKEYFATVQNFRKNYEKSGNSKLKLESTGRILAFIPHQNSSIETKQIESIKDDIQSEFSTKLTFTELSYNQIINREDGRQCIRNIVGRLVEMKLLKLDFTKEGSKGSVGTYFHYEHSNSKELSRDRVTLRTLFNFTIQTIWNDNVPKFYLTLDTKAEVRGTETLEELWKSNKKVNSVPVREWPGDLLEWNIKVDEIDNAYQNLKDNKYTIKDIKEYSEVRLNNVKLLNYGKYKDQTVEDFVNSNSLVKQNNTKIAELYQKSNPNIKVYLPIGLLFHGVTVHSITGKPYEDQFKKFSKPSLIERKNRIMEIFKILKENNIVNNVVRFAGEKPYIAYPSVNKKNETIFGRSPNLSNLGVEEWGSLEKITVYSSYKEFEVKMATKVMSELSKQLDRITNIMNLPKVKVSTKSVGLNEVKPFANDPESNPEAHLHLFIMGKGRESFSYKRLKTWFTSENKKPIQVIRFGSLNRNPPAIIRTVIPQIIAKTGGQPYTLYPKILDKTLIVGIDKSRDSKSKKASAAAGVSAVSTDGKYIAGASTQLDTSKDDKIDVSKLAPNLLNELKSTYKDKIEYIIILRDGSPDVCKDEVDPWRKYIEELGLKFLFFAARKENAYRIFPSYIEDERVKLALPVIFTDEPLQSNEFMVVTANSHQGTPQPALYTLMENTTTFDDQFVKDKVIPQIISMSMLCWESPLPTSQPLPLHYADKLGEFTTLVEQAWNSSIRSPQFI